MAELEFVPQTHTGARHAWAQFAAIAWLRWRIFANTLRRKGGAGELIGRILLFPFLLGLVLGPAATAGVLSYMIGVQGQLNYLHLILWAAFGLTQLLNINLGQPGTTFDPAELIRFPMALRHFVLVRLCFGLLSPANIVVTLISIAVAIGLSVARPELWFSVFTSMTVFALANVLFSRMIFAWIDRWLSTRRAREVFTALIFVASLAFQYVNVTYNPGFHGGRSHTITPENLHRAQLVASYLHPWVRWLPPELASSAIVVAQHGRLAAFGLDVSYIALYAGLFLTIYALRMRTEYRGENLSDSANAVRSAHTRRSGSGLPSEAWQNTSTSETSPKQGWLPATAGPLLAKELLVLRRNTGLLYGVIAPTVMVFLFAGRLSLRGGSHWLLLMAVSYALLGLAPMSYNSFGLEGPGAQFYFMAPVPLRDVFLAKNMMQFFLASFEALAVIAIIAYVAGRPSAIDIAFVLLWATMTLLLNTSIGNLRSISAPKKVNPGRSLNRAQSQVSAWIAIGILVVCAAVGAGLQFAGIYLGLRWFPLAILAALAVGACFVYRAGLASIERYAMDRRETLLEELGKKA